MPETPIPFTLEPLFAFAMFRLHTLLAENEHAGGNREVDQSGTIDCPGYSQDRNENEPCGKGAQHGSKCVHSV